MKENLYKVYELCLGFEYDKIIYDFALLYWAWGDLDYRDEVQYYWTGADKENIESIVVDTAKQWLKDNNDQYAQHGFAAIWAGNKG